MDIRVYQITPETWVGYVKLGQKLCSNSLTSSTPSCRRNVNFERVTRRLDIGHVVFSGFRFAVIEKKRQTKTL